METKFQTSFIPKKPLPSSPGSVTPAMPHKAGPDLSNVYMTIATIIFVISLLAVGGAYFAKIYFVKAQEDYKQQLAIREKEFNIEQISLMKAQSSKIALAQQLLNNHLATTKIFDVISKLTAESVRFLSMDVTVPVGTPGTMQISLAGYGKDFASVAFQSDVLNSLEKYNLRSVVRNPIVSNPTVNSGSSVSFGFTAQVDPSSFLYSKSLDVGAPADNNQ